MNKILSQETKLTVGLILIAFLFSVAVRMIWVYQFSDYDAFKFNNQLMINTNDGYYWAEGARDILNGTHQENDLSPINLPASKLTAYFAKILPFSLETIIFYLPVFLGSLIVIPIVLIGKAIKNIETGFTAALLASIAWSYYNRTMAGYYDTDMLNIVLPIFLLWSIIVSISTNKYKYLITTAVSILIYSWWYPQSYSLELSFVGLVLFYTLIFDRKNIQNYQLLSVMIIAILNLYVFITVPIVLIFAYLLRKEKLKKYNYYLFLISIVLFFLVGGFAPIWDQLKGYVFKDVIEMKNTGLKLSFFSTMQTVREAGQISFETFANRISGHVITFLLSIGGFLYLVYRHKIMLLSLPLLGLGFLAYIGGLRFTIYAVPVLALGVSFLITDIASRMPTSRLKYLSMVAFTLMILYPNYLHVKKYRVPTVFNSDEVNIINQLGKIANREDYVVSWWDYGYPIRYYSDVKTLIDGAKHDGSVNYPVSFILTNPQNVSAKMARLDVEYTEFQKTGALSNIERMTVDYGFNNTNDFLAFLKRNVTLPKKTRDIYLYLPFRMLSVYPTITQFSNINLMNGEKIREPFFYMTRNFKETKNEIDLRHGIAFDKSSATLNIAGRKIPVRRFVQTVYDNNMNLHKNSQLLNFSGTMSIIYMANYGTFLVLDEETYNSLYIQLMVLEEYDKMLFEKVIMNPNAKVYKLKI